MSKRGSLLKSVWEGEEFRREENISQSEADMLSKAELSFPGEGGGEDIGCGIIDGSIVALGINEEY